MYLNLRDNKCRWKLCTFVYIHSNKNRHETNVLPSYCATYIAMVDIIFDGTKHAHIFTHT